MSSENATSNFMKKHDKTEKTKNLRKRREMQVKKMRKTERQK